MRIFRYYGWIALMNLRTLPLLVILCALLGACASTPPPKALLDETEVRATRGTPTQIWDNADGTRTFEYSTQPQGTSAWMYTVDAGGKVIAQYDALSADNRARVKPGMSPEQVLRLLGRERSRQRFAASQEEVWDWRIPRDWPTAYATFFNVHFEHDLVTKTSISRLERDDSGMRFGFGFGSGFGSRWGVGFGWPHYYHPGFGCCW